MNKFMLETDKFDKIEIDGSGLTVKGIPTNVLYSLPDGFDCKDLAQILTNEDLTDLETTLTYLKKNLDKLNVTFMFKLKQNRLILK